MSVGQADQLVDAIILESFVHEANANAEGAQHGRRVPFIRLVGNG